MISSQFDAVIPMLCVTLAGLVVLLAEAFRSRDEKMPIGGLAIIGLVGAGIASILLWDRNTESFGAVTADNFALFVNLVLVVVGILTVVFSAETVERDRLPAGEYYAVLLFAIVGMMLMGQATDLLVIFLALETMSIAVYVLTGIRRDQQQSTEAAFKYFLLGAFASSFFLYGIAFLYGTTGTTNIDELSTRIAAQSMSGNPMILLGIGLLIVGFGFKIAAVPFHMWSPDAYEGAPAVVTGFMSTGVKAAAVAAFVRVFLKGLDPMIADWAPVLWWIAAATMIIGTVVGVAQTSLKRMLAYSSIAHGGYLLAGLVAGNEVGKSAILFYLAAYALTNLGAFGVISLLGTARARQRRSAGLCRPVVFAPGPGDADDVLPTVAWRLPAHRRLHREVVHLLGRGRLGLLRPGHHRRAVERGLGVLLPAHRGDDVHDRARRPPGAGADLAAGDGRPDGGDARRALPRRPADAPDRAGAAIDRHNFLNRRSQGSKD